MFISFEIMKINIFDKINNLKLEKIKINNSTILDGIFLRKLLVKYLNNIPEIYIPNNLDKLKLLNDQSQIERMNINSAIQSENLITDSKYYNKKTGKLKLIPLKNRINKFNQL